MDPRIEALARLIVEFGANVQPGQVVDVGAEIGKEEMARAVATFAYRRGAKFVDVRYYDPYVKHARVAEVADESLEYVPSWLGDRVLKLGEARAASISLTGPAASPQLFADLDPARLGRDVYPRLKEWMQVTNDRTVNWCIAPCPTRTWAELVHTGLDSASALERLWEQISFVCRLDEPDPAAAWRERSVLLKDVAARLTDRRLDALRFEGNGTDLTVGLLPTSRWVAGSETTVDGIEHFPNLPTEEVFTTPDPERTEGDVRATMPLLASGAIIEGLRIRFEHGRAVQIDADKRAETVRALASRDENAARLGEVALVDDAGRIGKTATVYYDTLLDENAASHIALGDGYMVGVEADDHARVNRSALHLDFMIGGAGVDVTGVTREGERVPVLVDGGWRI